MIMTNKLLPVALVAALIGGSVGALVMHSRNPTTTDTQASTVDTSKNGNAQNAQNAQDAQYQPNQASLETASKEQTIPVEYNTVSEQSAYKTGFADGFKACEGGVSGSRVNSSAVYSQPRVVYRNAGRSYVRNSTASAYQRPRSRTFWQKHRDKLTVAAGTGGGALIGGLIGGKKGAAIGALGGGGGSALYTYKIRKRNRRY